MAGMPGKASLGRWPLIESPNDRYVMARERSSPDTGSNQGKANRVSIDQSTGKREELPEYRQKDHGTNTRSGVLKAKVMKGHEGVSLDFSVSA